MEALVQWIMDNWGKIIAFAEKLFDVIAEAAQ